MKDTLQSEKLFELFQRNSHFISRGHHHKDGGHHGQGRILSILGNMSTMSQKELLDILKIRTASLSELLIKLENNDFITRIKDENDKRNFIISVTEKGKSAVAEFEQHRRETAEVLFGALSDEEKATLVSLLQKLNDAWQEGREQDDCGRGHRHHGGNFHSEHHGRHNKAHQCGHHRPEHGHHGSDCGHRTEE